MRHIKSTNIIVHGRQATIYNDSNVDWVIECDGVSPQRFPIKKFTRKESIKFFCEVFSKEYLDNVKT